MLAVVGARLNSSRLPRKHLLDLNGHPLIHHIFRRLSACARIDHAVLATTSDTYNASLTDWADHAGIDFVSYTGDVNDLVGRVAAVVEKYSPQYLVYICGDCPLIDPQYIDRALDVLARDPGMDAVACAQDTEGRKSIHEGMHIYSRQGWEKIAACSHSPQEREHLGLASPDDFQIYSLEEDKQYYEVSTRISVDTAADYRFMRHVYQRWYAAKSADSIVSLPWVVEALQQDASLKNINAHVMQKSGYRSYGAIALVCEASPEKGLGQLKRCVAIAERVQEEAGLGTKLYVLGPRQAHPFTRYCRCDYFESEEGLLRALKKDTSPLVVLDIFPERQETPEKWHAILLDKHRRGVKLLGIDRALFWSDYMDKVVVAVSSPPPKVAPNIVWGMEYFLATKVPWQPKDALLILTGGSDTFGYGARLPKALDAVLPENSRIQWVQGPFAAAPNLPDTPRCQWQVIHSPNNMGDLMSDAYAAIAVYGMSLIELLTVGVPSAVLPPPQAENDVGYQDVVKSQACLTLSPDLNNLAQVTQALFDQTARDALVKHMASLPLGEGATKIVGELLILLDQT